MSQLTDCPSCGGLLPVGKQCCPHCHCKYPVLKRVRLIAAAALGLGAAGCDSTPLDDHTDLGDMRSPIGSVDISYGPFIPPPDLTTNDDGGTE